MTAAAQLLLQLCVHTAALDLQLYPDSRSTRVDLQQTVVLLMYTKKYGRTYAVCTTAVVYA